MLCHPQQDIPEKVNHQRSADKIKTCVYFTGRNIGFIGPHI